MKKVLWCVLVSALLLSLLATGTSCTRAKAGISFRPSSLHFTAVQGESSPPGQSLAIWSSGGETLDWSASVNATWLNLSETGGSWSGSVIGVAVDTSQMSAGNYSATITISASGAANRFQTIPVSLTILPPPRIEHSSSSLYFTATEGASNPPIQSISIWNSGGGTLDWSISGNATWLNLSPTDGSSTSYVVNDITVAVHTKGISAGTYTAIITISAPGATNTPQTIPVSLTIKPVPPTPTPAPTPTPTPTLTATPTPTSAPWPTRIPAITITPQIGPVGSSATVNGTGFPSSRLVYISIGMYPVALATADTNGNFSATVTIPYLPAGPQTVSAVGAPSSASTTFIVTATT